MMPSSEFQYYDFGQFRLDVQNRQLLINGELVGLTQKSFSILHFLVENHERIVSKEELISNFWEENYVEESNLVQHIYRIRKALKDKNNEVDYIKTVSKHGYQFIAGVELKVVNGKSPETNVEEITNKEIRPAENSKNNSSRKLKEADSLRPQKIAGQNGVKRKILVISAAAVIFLLSVWGLYFYGLESRNTETTNIESMAILPFRQIGEKDMTNENLGLGMADTLIAKLSNQKKISVLPTTTIIKFLKEGNEDPEEIGQALEVDAVLTGTIQRENEAVRINVQMIRAKNGTLLWSEEFDSNYSEIFSLQNKISQKIARKLSLEPNKKEEILWETKHTEDIEAYKAYSNGLFYWNKRTPKELAKAIEYFQTAIEKDAQFAKAHALLADSYSLIAFNKYDLLPEKEAMSKAEQLAGKALELDSNSSEAFATLALIRIYEHNVKEALPLLQKAIELNPNNTTAYFRLVWIYALEGNLDQIITEMKKAHRIDPQSDAINRNLAYYLVLAKKTDEALAFSQRIMEVSPPSVELNIFLAEIYEQKKEYEKAIRELEFVLSKEPDNQTARLVLSRVYAKTNKAQKARKILNKTVSQKISKKHNYLIASIYLYLGEKDKALDLFKKIEDHLLHLLNFKYDYNLEPVRNTPEINQIIASMETRLKSN